MLPTPRDVRATHRFAGALAVLVTAGGALCGAWLPGGLLAGAAGAALGALTGMGAYALITRRVRRRRQALARPFPHAWRDVLMRRVAFYRRLPADGRERFERMVRVFLAETPIAGAGVEVDDEVRVLVAAGAVIPVFALPGWEYDRLREVVIQPRHFDSTFGYDDLAERPALGMVGDRGGAFHGVMVLSKEDLLEGFDPQAEARTHNVAIHEFAHLVDKADGWVDGVPPGLAGDARRAWIEVVQRELDRRGRSDISAYGLSSPEEFFPVVSEYFFGDPARLRRNHPELYDMLRSIYRHPDRPSEDD